MNNTSSIILCCVPKDLCLMVRWCLAERSFQSSKLCTAHINHQTSSPLRFSLIQKDENMLQYLGETGIPHSVVEPVTVANLCRPERNHALQNWVTWKIIGIHQSGADLTMIFASSRSNVCVTKAWFVGSFFVCLCWIESQEVHWFWADSERQRKCYFYIKDSRHHGWAHLCTLGVQTTIFY